MTVQDETHAQFAEASTYLHRRVKRGLLAYSYRELYEMQLAVNRAMAEIETVDGENDRAPYQRNERLENETEVQRDATGAKIERNGYDGEFEAAVPATDPSDPGADFLNGKF